MANYEFRTAHVPGCIVRDDHWAKTQYQIASGLYGGAEWGGVMEVIIAKSLRPWAKPVKMGFDAFKVRGEPWQELKPGEELWGCMLRGPESGQFVVFVLLERGWPVVSGRQNA